MIVKIIAGISAILVLAILIVSILPISAETRIEITVYLGLPLCLLLGSAGVKFIINVIFKIVWGVAAAAIFIALLTSLF